MEVIRREYEDEEVIRVVSNVSAPTSSRVMLHMGIGYSIFVRQQATMQVSVASAKGLTDLQTDISRAAIQWAVDRATRAGVTNVSAIEAEYNALAATIGSEVTAKCMIAQPKTVAVVFTAARRSRTRANAQLLHRFALRAADVRRGVAHKMRVVRSPQKAAKQ